MSVEEKRERLRALRDEALHAGSAKAVERQHARGKLTARERIDLLLDPGSFTELDMFTRHRSHGFGLEDNRPWGDGVVTGHGTVDGRRVYVFSQDFTVFGGSLGEVFAEKICKVMDLAVKMGCPLIGINDSGGARIQEGVVSLAGYADIFFRNVRASGVIPQISVVLGPCAGGAVYSPAITDFIFMVRETSHMFITGPEVIRTVTGEEVSMEELGGAQSHATRSGVCQFAADSEQECLEMVRDLLGYIPQNNLELPPHVPTADPVDRQAPELATIIPDQPTKPYDVKKLIELVVDDGEFFEVAPLYAQNIVIGYARLNGHSVGIVGNQPRSLAGVLDIDASVKAARFIRFCDAFNVPVVSFVHETIEADRIAFELDVTYGIAVRAGLHCAGSGASCRSSSRIRIRRSTPGARSGAHSPSRSRCTASPRRAPRSMHGSRPCSTRSACRPSRRTASRTNSPAASASASASRARCRSSRS